MKLHHNARDITGQRFGKLTALRPVQSHRGKLRWLFLCDCGRHHEAVGTSVTSGDVVSCGCYRSRLGGRPNRKAYHSWYNMHQRCSNPQDKSFQHYGERGIRVCDRWRSFSAFLEDMGRPSKGESLDRIDVDGDYEPSNCRWATPGTQANNKTNNRVIIFRAQSLTLAQWAERLGLTVSCLWRRLHSGMPIERALTCHPLKEPCER